MNSSSVARSTGRVPAAPPAISRAAQAPAGSGRTGVIQGAGKVGVVRTELVKVKMPALSGGGMGGGAGARTEKQKQFTPSSTSRAQPVTKMTLCTPPVSAASSGTSSAASSPGKRSPPKPPILVRTSFVIKGKVQGVYFRKFTQQKAVELGIFGVVRNELDGSVTGVAEGRIDAIFEFKNWLQSKGSPKSRIESADFLDVQGVESRKFLRFDIDRSVEG